MSGYELFKEILDVIYLFIGIGIGFTVFIGYKQLRIMKRESEQNHYRLSVEKSLEYISRFSVETLPLLKTYEAMLAKKSDNRKGFTNKMAFIEKTSNLTEGDIVDLGKHGVFRIINELNILATVVNTGIADKEVVFQSLGKLFCEAVEVTYDVIQYFRDSEHRNLFNETEILYKEWRKNFEQINIGVTV